MQSFINTLVKSELKADQLIVFEREAMKRLSTHLELHKLADENFQKMHINYGHQTRLEIGIIQSIIYYQHLITQERHSTAIAPTANSSAQPSPFHAVHSNSLAANESITNSSITESNDFTPEGLRQMLETTMLSTRARQQLTSYIAQLEINTLAHSLKTDSTVTEHYRNETLLLRRENEILRERLARFEASLHSSNVSSPSASSIVYHEPVIEQPKHFDWKRRSLADEQQQLPAAKIDSSPMVKKVCLDDTIDSSNQKAQAERGDDEEARTTNTMDDRHE